MGQLNAFNEEAMNRVWIHGYFSQGVRDLQ